MNLPELLSDFELLVPRDAVFLAESSECAVGQLRPVPRVDEDRTVITRGPSTNRLMLKDRVFRAGDDKVPARVKATRCEKSTEIADFPSRRSVEHET